MNNCLSTEEVPRAVQLEVEIEYANKSPGGPPLRRKHLLKQRCCGNTFHGPVRVPEEAAAGFAKVHVKIVGWAGQEVRPATFDVAVED